MNYSTKSKSTGDGVTGDGFVLATFTGYTLYGVSYHTPIKDFP